MGGGFGLYRFGRLFGPLVLLLKVCLALTTGLDHPLDSPVWLTLHWSRTASYATPLWLLWAATPVKIFRRRRSWWVGRRRAELALCFCRPLLMFMARVERVMAKFTMLTAVKMEINRNVASLV